MRYILAFAACLAAAPAMADYSDHHAVRLFTEAPCTKAVAEIDQSFERYAERGLEAFQEMSRSIASQGMAWGFLLGFDTAAGGLSGDEETTLVRLRKACAENPETPAMELLRGFDQD